MAQRMAFSIRLTEAQAAALIAEAEAYQQTPEDRLRTWAAPALESACKLYEAAQWEARKRKLAANATLSRLVDETPVRTG